MNNIIFEKISDVEDNTLYLRILAQSDKVMVKQDLFDVYVSDLLNASTMFTNYLNNNQETVIKFSDAFNDLDDDLYIKLMPQTCTGHLKLEIDIKVDIEYGCTKNKSHRCCFFIDTEISAIEQFLCNLSLLVDGDIGYKVSLYDI